MIDFIYRQTKTCLVIFIVVVTSYACAPGSLNEHPASAAANVTALSIPQYADESGLPNSKRDSLHNKLRTLFPFGFEKNRGQVNQGAAYFIRTPTGNLAVSATHIDFLPHTHTLAMDSDISSTQRRNAHKKQGDQYRIVLLDANKSATPMGEKLASGKINRFIGNDPNEWVKNITLYESVRINEVYPNIDFIIFAHPEKEIEYQFLVRPGGDPSDIIMSIDGFDSFEISKSGELHLSSMEMELRKSKPIAFQEIKGEKTLVSADFERIDKKTISFDLENYDTSVALTIDPYLSFSSYFGTPEFDDIWDSAIDGDGNMYVTGGTGFNLRNTFVAKIDPISSTIIYTTIIGGSGDDIGLGIDVDSNGNAFVTGHSSTEDFPVTPGAYIDPDNPDGDGAFILKLSPDGSTLEYATVLGSGFARGLDVAVDSNGSAYLTGEGNSGFPSTEGSIGACPQYRVRPFVAKMSPDGSDLEFSGCIVGGGNGNGIAIDAARNVYIGGDTDDPLFPTTPGAFDTECPAYCDKSFVTKINSQGTAILYSTFFGGSDTFTNIQGIAVDCSGSAHITGQTKSAELPVTPGLIGPNEWTGTTGDAFAAKLNANGEQLIYSTYLGSTNFEVGWEIDASCDGKSYITGEAGNLFPVTSDAFWVPPFSGPNAFITVIASAGDRLIFSTLLGGDGWDIGRGINVDSAGNIFVAGHTRSDNFPLVLPVQEEIAGGTSDGFISVITFNDSDGDGIENASDNCLMHPNSDQLDSDNDDIGNVCDCDFNQDDFCGGPDFTTFIGCFNASTGGNPTCEAADMNGDEFVGGPDFTLFIGGFNGPPGPSGLVP